LKQFLLYREPIAKYFCVADGYFIYDFFGFMQDKSGNNVLSTSSFCGKGLI